MKYYLIFNMNCPEDKEDLKTMQKANDMRFALEDIHNKVWRPSWKHGYSDPELQALVEKLGDDGGKLIEKLHEIYVGLLNEYEINF